MGIAITFRHMTPSDALKNYVNEKLERVQKYLREPLDAHVTLFTERHLHVAEMHISAVGRQHQARHESEDMYKSIDFVLDKIEHQISKHHDAQARKNKGAENARSVGANATVETEGSGGEET